MINSSSQHGGIPGSFGHYPKYNYPHMLCNGFVKTGKDITKIPDEIQYVSGSYVISLRSVCAECSNSKQPTIIKINLAKMKYLRLEVSFVIVSMEVVHICG